MASVAITVMIGLPTDQVSWVIAATGLVAVIYTSLGGLRAVVVSDVVQSIILMGGAVATLGIITWRMSGFSWFPTTWNPNWEAQPIFSFDPRVRITLIGVIIMTFFYHISTAGGDQLAIQRYMATRNAAKALSAARSLSLAVGLCAVLIASQIGHVPGNFLEVTKKTTNLLAGPIFGLFFLAVFCPKTRAFGAWIGTAWGFLVALLIAYWDVLTGLRPLSFQYIIPPALAAQIATTLLLSKIPLPETLPSRWFLAFSLVAIPASGIIVLATSN